MAKINTKLEYDSVYSHLIEKDPIKRKSVCKMEMINPDFKSNKLDEYERDEKYPSVPFRMIIVGSSGSGKSELIKKIYNKEPGFYCQRDFMNWYGKYTPYDLNTRKFPSHDADGKQHGVIAYDDPTPEYYSLISDVFRLGRPRGISPIVAIHSWDQLIQSPKLRILKDQANIIVLCKEAATEVFERHLASFNGFIRCPSKMRKQQLFSSLNGDWDYNWIVNGKDCVNYKIGYPETVKDFKTEIIDVMYPETCPSSDSDTSSCDSDSEISDDGDDMQCPRKKIKTDLPEIDIEDLKDKYQKDYKKIQSGYKKR